jgi:hypothetical protein
VRARRMGLLKKISGFQNEADANDWITNKFPIWLEELKKARQSSRRTRSQQPAGMDSGPAGAFPADDRSFYNASRLPRGATLQEFRRRSQAPGGSPI